MKRDSRTSKKFSESPPKMELKQIDAWETGDEDIELLKKDTFSKCRLLGSNLLEERSLSSPFS